MKYQGGEMEYPCGSFDSPPAQESSEPWWATGTAQMIMAIVGIVGSLGAGAFTYYRMRSRRRALTVTLLAIESAYAEAKGGATAGIRKLTELRARVRADHQKGKLDDGHFLELDRRATQYLGNLRLLEIDRRFRHLPPLLLAEVRRFLSDGMLTQSEADLIEVRAAAYRIPDPARAELVTITRAWANEDGSREDALTTVA